MLLLPSFPSHTTLSGNKSIVKTCELCKNVKESPERKKSVFFAGTFDEYDHKPKEILEPAKWRVTVSEELRFMTS